MLYPLCLRRHTNDHKFRLKKEEIGVGKNGQEDEDNHRLDHAAGHLFNDVKAHDDSEQ